MHWNCLWVCLLLSIGLFFELVETLWRGELALCLPYTLYPESRAGLSLKAEFICLCLWAPHREVIESGYSEEQ